MDRQSRCIKTIYKYKNIEIGLPGPVFGGETEIYMPPLGYSIDIFTLKKKLMNLNISVDICNDCKLLHKIARRLPKRNIFKDDRGFQNDSGSICISIGTSFGINGITRSGCSISLEMAHILWFHLIPSQTKITKDIDFYKCTISDVLNSSYILSSLRECNSSEEIYDLGESLCEALLSSAQMTASLLGINKFQIIVVTGIYLQIENLLQKANIKNLTAKCAKGLTILSICPQEHLSTSRSLS